MSNKTLIIVHHSESDSSTFAKIKSFHTAPKAYDSMGDPLGNGWAHIGYHKVIENSGRVYQGLQDHQTGIHTVNWNHCSLAVCICGNFDKHQIRPPQWQSLIQVVAQWCLSHNIHPSSATIVGHKDKQPSKTKMNGAKYPNTCPGGFLYSRLPELRIEVAKQLAVAGLVA